MLVFEVLPLNKTLMRCGFLALKTLKGISAKKHTCFKSSVSQLLFMHLSIFCPSGGGGGHTRGFRQKTNPDRREFDKLMESGSRVIDFYILGLDAPSRLKGGDLDKNGCL